MAEKGHDQGAGMGHAAAAKTTKKWTGGIHGLITCNLDAAWRLEADFLGLMSWAPTIVECRLVDGEPNAVGCLRYVKGSDGFWSQERLLELDHVNHYMVYSMEKNRFAFPHGLQGYVSRIRFGDAGDGQVWVHWTYEVDPVIGETEAGVTQYMIDFYNGSLKYLEEGANKLKWRGGVQLLLTCKLDAAWKLQSDFLGLLSWVPGMTECRLLEGEPNAIGCLRYCKGSDAFWVQERLLELDHGSHFMSYRMEDNLFFFPHGVQGYVAEVRLGEAGGGQIWVSWTYEMDPVIGETQGKLTKFMIDFYTANLKYLEDGANKLPAAHNSDHGAAAAHQSSPHAASHQPAPAAAV